MYTLFGMSASGNCYKVRLLLEQLGAAYHWREIDILAGETEGTEFLAKNPIGRVPILEIAPGQYLAESNAILCYLAEGTPFWSSGPLERAETLKWMFFEQHSHVLYIAGARWVSRFLPAEHPRRKELPFLRERGHQALEVMERQLAAHPFFANDHYSIADIALFAYTHIAEEGGFDMARFPATREWIARVKGQPHYTTMAAAS